ncbi:hypothetical protein T439DRAFT_356794 [Meredithblackwellia eburnea MCA 4105]
MFAADPQQVTSEFLAHKFIEFKTSPQSFERFESKIEFCRYLENEEGNSSHQGLNAGAIKAKLLEFEYLWSRNVSMSHKATYFRKYAEPIIAEYKLAHLKADAIGLAVDNLTKKLQEVETELKTAIITQNVFTAKLEEEIKRCKTEFINGQRKLEDDLPVAETPMDEKRRENEYRRQLSIIREDIKRKCSIPTLQNSRNQSKTLVKDLTTHRDEVKTKLNLAQLELEEEEKYWLDVQKKYNKASETDGEQNKSGPSIPSVSLSDSSRMALDIQPRTTTHPQVFTSH